MDLHEYLRLLRRSWLLITTIALASLLLGGATSILVKPTYTAETELFVALQGSGTISELQQGNTFSQARVKSYVQTVTTPAVLQPVIDELGLQESAGSLANRVEATADLNTVIIGIQVTDESPARAAAAAQSIANSLVKTVDNLEKPKNGGSSPVSLSIITPAVAPSSPSSPNIRLNLILSALIGTAIGVGTAILRSTLDSRVHGESDLKRVTQAPILGGIAYDQDASKYPLLTQAAAQSSRAESFRQLRTNLQFANISGTSSSVLITSSLPGEGKSTTATNLAIALAQAGQTVCLVDADLRRPMVNEYLGLDRSLGLTTALLGTSDVDDLLHPWGEDSLYVLTAGQIPPNPSELLGSPAMQQLLSRLEASFDSVIIDAPPLLPVTDAAVLSQYVGGVVVVVGVQVLKIPELERSMSALKLVGANLLGVVLNRLPAKGPDAYTYSYTSYKRHDSTHETSSPPIDAGVEQGLRRARDVSYPDNDRDSAVIGQQRNPVNFPIRSTRQQ